VRAAKAAGKFCGFTARLKAAPFQSYLSLREKGVDPLLVSG